MLKLSYSKIHTFEECRRKYKYQYIDKLPTKDKPWFQLGTFVHATLETCAHLLSKGKSINASMSAAFKQTRAKLPMSEMMLDEIRPWLQIFAAQYANIDSEILFIERRFGFPLYDKFYINGIIDRVDRTKDGVLQVIDYKTSKSMQYLDDLQLCIYALALRNLDVKYSTIVAWFSMVRFNFRQRPEGGLSMTDEKAQQTIDRLQQVGEHILNEKEWDITRTSRCQLCDFFQQCFTDSPVNTWI